MYRTLITAFLISLSCNAMSNGFCTFTQQENEYFEFTEHFPFSDKDYSPESVSESKKRLDAHKSGAEVKYYINENTTNIINGGLLQKEMLLAKKDLEVYVFTDATKWDRKSYDLKYKYLTARKHYCDFRRTHYAIDW